MNCSGPAVPEWSPRHFSSSFRLGSSSDLLGPFFISSLLLQSHKNASSIQFIPYIPWEMAKCFPRAELSRKHHFRFTLEVITPLLVIPEVKSRTESDDRKSGVNTGSDLISAESHMQKPIKYLMHSLHRGSNTIRWHTYMVHLIICIITPIYTCTYHYRCVLISA